MTQPVTRKLAIDCLLDRFASIQTYLICQICDKPILAGQDIQFDHHHAIIHDGPHDYKNLRPLHKDCHKLKTAQDIKDNCKIKRLTGQTKGRPKRKWAKGAKIPSRPFQKRAE